MSRLPAIVSSEGYVPGVNEPEQMICQYLHMTGSMGCSWFGCDVSTFSLPLLMLQLSMIFIVSHTTFFLLKPLRQSILSCQLIVRIYIHASMLSFLKSLFDHALIRLFLPGLYCFHLVRKTRQSPPQQTVPGIRQVGS